MKKVVDSLRLSKKAKKILIILVLLFFGFYVFSTPYFSDRTPFNYLVYGIFAIFTFLVFCHKYLYGNIKKINCRPFLFLCFALFASISTIIVSRQFRYLLTVFLIAISFFVFFLFFEEIKDIDLIIRLVILSLSLFVLLFVIHYRTYLISPSNWGTSRLASDNYYDNVNNVAYYFSGCSILSLYYSLYGKKKYKLLFLLPYPLSSFLGILTASRAFLISVLLTSLILCILKFRKKPIVLIVGLVIIITGIILLFTLPAFDTLRQRLVGMFNMITGDAYSTDYSTATRILWQDYAMYLGVRAIFFGNGINSFAVLSGTGTYTHANIAELICNSGIIGLLLYYLIPFVALSDCFTKKNNRKALIIAIFVFLLSREFVDVTYTSKFNAFIFALMSYCGYLGIPKQHKFFMRAEKYYVLEI